jgi:rfaE bifunctional protein nucleotidyltransferase chain/domain
LPQQFESWQVRKAHGKPATQPARNRHITLRRRLVLAHFHHSGYRPTHMNFRDKIVPWDGLAAWRSAFRAKGGKLVVTNGCFDLLHLGHVTYLENARNLGDALLVGVNGDSAVQGLKGPGRPVTTESDRAAVLAALESVNAVCIFTERTATSFLALARPDIYVKGGDYTLETLNQQERHAVESAGGKISIIPFVPGKSTTAILQKIVKL